MEQEVLWTEEHLMALPDIGFKAEVLDGRLTMMAPAGGGHGSYSMRLGAALLAFVEANELGAVFESSTGFTLDRDNVVSPDVAFVSKARIRKLGGVPEGFVPGAPDLAVEVLSPSERSGAVKNKVKTYLTHGTRAVWVVDPKAKAVIVHRAGARPRRCVGVLEGGEVLPGFRIAVKEIFRQPKW